MGTACLAVLIDEKFVEGWSYFAANRHALIAFSILRRGLDLGIAIDLGEAAGGGRRPRL
jgi:hypothetical protein